MSPRTTAQDEERWSAPRGCRKLRIGNRRLLRSRARRPSARAVGVDFTHEQIAKAARVRDRDGFPQITSSKLHR
jgi:hypothetical protein